MQPNHVVREALSSPGAVSASFGISSGDTAHIMGILRDSLYTDKIRAVLREYGSNAWDAHRDAGIPDKPINVHLPTAEDPTLRIRDFGKGLSREQVFTVYTQYGASTKRDSNTAVGMLGIGSKSGFAYADSFTITSWNGGKQSIYSAALDASDKGLITLLYEQDCGEETGVEIAIVVKPGDMEEFTDKAQKLFAYFNPRPTINTTFEEHNFRVLKNGYLDQKTDGYYGDRGWVAVMGCVPYTITPSQLESDLPQHLWGQRGVLFFDIGDVTISASREELRYTPETKAKIIQKLSDLVDEFIITVLTEIEASGVSPWQKKVKALQLEPFKKVLQKDDQGRIVSVVRLDTVNDKKEPLIDMSKVTLQYAGGALCEVIYVSPDTKLLLNDRPANRTLEGYRLQRNKHFLIKGETADIEKFLDDAGIRGIPMQPLTDMEWVGKGRKGGTKRAQHRKKFFVLIDPRHYYGSPYSENWDAVEREPQDDDVFFVLREFSAQHTGHIKQDYEIITSAGLPFPPIYGYKSTSSKPVFAENCQGTPYETWRTKVLTSLITPERQAEFDHDEYRSAHERLGGRYGSHIDDGSLLAITMSLGEAHPIVQYLKRVHASQQAKTPNREVFKPLVSTSDARDRAVRDYKALQKTYPIMTTLESLFHTVEHRWEDFLEYVQLIDNKKENP